MKSSSEAFCWSKIGSIGKSYVGRMTIVMPLIGYLIIFNPFFVTFFQSEIPGGTIDAPQWLSALHAMRLSFLYFGLLLVGFGMGLYLLAAPDQIKRFPSVSDYILEMEKVWSPALVWDSFVNTILRSQNWPDGVAPHAVYCVGDPSFPDNASYYLNELIASACKELNEFELSPEAVRFELEGTMAESPPYHTSLDNGHISTTQIMDFITNEIGAGQAFGLSLKSIISEKRKEVFYVEHKSLDYERYSIRMFVAAFFIAGIFFLIVPTLSTSLMVLLA